MTDDLFRLRASNPLTRQDLDGLVPASERAELLEEILMSAPVLDRTQQRPRRARRWVAVIGAVAAVAVLAVAAPLALNRDDAPTLAAAGSGKPVDILVLGSDSRSCDGCQVDGERGPAGSDTTLLVHLAADRRSAYALSIPRDLIVTPPACGQRQGTGQQRWNAAYVEGGGACVAEQLESVTGELCEECRVTVDHVVDLDFAAIPAIVDALGGIDVCLPEKVADPYTGARFHQGSQTLDGREALDYVRLRHGLGDGGDLDRITRQQAFLASMTSKILAAGTLSDLDTVLAILEATGSGLKTDLDLRTLAELAAGLDGIGRDDVTLMTVPTETEPQDLNALLLDETAAADLFEAVANDDPAPSPSKPADDSRDVGVC
ncbi:putative cell envelope-related transcriptional attenuator domain protein [Nocardioidaceae bacterium Broad-1]|nr:putative cell envelope-related transcriptional attenuator domain protein [Nocardioidaceae bacterium Broad-1]